MGNRLNAEVLGLAVDYASQHITTKIGAEYAYHNLSHTVYVAKKAAEMAKESGLDKQQRNILQVAAWFHDTGYAEKATDHETIGAGLAEEFLRGHDIDPSEIADVRSCILATRMPQQPVSLIEKILCDADMAHLAGGRFIEGAERLRREWAGTRQREFTDEDWVQLNIEFLSGHRYWTVYAQQHLEPRKLETVEKLRKQVRKKKADRGVETMFKTASGNHMHLSGMADNKAHILLSINSIIISVILSFLARKLSEASYLVIPTIMLLCVSLATIVFAVLSTKPKVSRGIFTKDQIEKREVNLLFFGNFHRMQLDQYQWGVREMMYDKDYLYKSITKDIYFLGKVLATKYKYLNIGYTIFMWGLIASIAAFAISFLTTIYK
jgi:predicted metal-dependent HD superfamily phosphohydrolase